MELIRAQKNEQYFNEVFGSYLDLFDCKIERLYKSSGEYGFCADMKPEFYDFIMEQTELNMLDRLSFTRNYYEYEVNEYFEILEQHMIDFLMIEA